MKSIFNGYIIITAIVVMSLSSCLNKEDEINYIDVILPDSVIVTNVTDPNNTSPERKVMIKEESDKGYSFNNVNILLDEVLKIEADVYYTGPFPISYEWILDSKIISTDKVLIITPIENETYIKLNIKRGDDKAGTDYKVNIIATSEFANGLFVLATHNGETVLDFFRYYTVGVEDDITGKPGVYEVPRIEEVPNVFRSVNGKNIPGTKPVGLVSIRSNKSEFGLQLLDEDYNNSVTILSKTIEENASMRDEWIGAPAAGFKIKQMSSLLYSDFLIGEDGSMHSRTNYDFGYPNTGRFSPTPMEYNDPSDIPDAGWEKINATYFVSYSLSGTLPLALVYEKSKKRFLGVQKEENFFITADNIDIIKLHKLTDIVLKDNEVDLNNFDKEIVTIFSQNGLTTWPDFSNNAFVDIIYKDGDNYRMQAVNFAYNSNNFSYKIVFNQPLAPELVEKIKVKNAKIYKNATLDRTYELITISGNSVYKSDNIGNELTKLISFDSEVILFNKVFSWTTNVSSVENKYYKGKVFAVGLANGEFKIIRLYEDPNKPDETLVEYLVEKKYNGTVVDSKFFWSNKAFQE